MCLDFVFGCRLIFRLQRSERGRSSNSVEISISMNTEENTFYQTLISYVIENDVNSLSNLLFMKHLELY